MVVSPTKYKGKNDFEGISNTYQKFSLLDASAFVYVPKTPDIIYTRIIHHNEIL